VEPAVLEQLYRSADIFVSASLYEGYGMAAAEALVRGLPIVASLGGALATTIPDEAALTCPPGDVEGLRDALSGMLTNGPVRAACAEAAWAAGQKLPTWQQNAGRITDALARCGGLPRPAP
jgi:glycosyltransferase involved in cell wall biosynthesis